MATCLKILSLALSALGGAAACTGDPKASLNDEWRQMMQCSAFFTLRAASARESRTAAAQRAADSAHADALLSLGYSYELGALAGKPMAETDNRLRGLGAELLADMDAKLANIGHLRTRYEDLCRSTLTQGESRILYWRHGPQD